MGDAYQQRAQMYLAWPLWTKGGALFMSQRRSDFQDSDCIEGSLKSYSRPDFCDGRAMGSCQPRRMAINRSPKQRTAPIVAAADVGRFSIFPRTMRAAPINAATA
jgi:hypothetical protein